MPMDLLISIVEIDKANVTFAKTDKIQNRKIQMHKIIYELI